MLLRPLLDKMYILSFVPIYNFSLRSSRQIMCVRRWVGAAVAVVSRLVNIYRTLFNFLFLGYGNDRFGLYSVSVKRSAQKKMYSNTDTTSEINVFLGTVGRVVAIKQPCAWFTRCATHTMNKKTDFLMVWSNWVLLHVIFCLCFYSICYIANFRWREKKIPFAVFQFVSCRLQNCKELHTIQSTQLSYFLARVCSCFFSIQFSISPSSKNNTRSKHSLVVLCL